MKRFTHRLWDPSDVLLTTALVCALGLMAGIVIAVQPLFA